jgi:hypothetical protein
LALDQAAPPCAADSGVVFSDGSALDNNGDGIYELTTIKPWGDIM